VPDRNIKLRYVVMYHVWPIDSRDDEDAAYARMDELKARQLRSWRDRWPLHTLDNSTMWKIVDTGARSSAAVAVERA